VNDPVPLIDPVAFDLVIIGAGPAGQKAAVQGAKVGKSVLVIERGDKIGGECVRRGTIPSKALREQAIEIAAFRERMKGILGKSQTQSVARIQTLAEKTDGIVAQQVAVGTRQLERNGVVCWHGNAAFESDRVVAVTDVRGHVRRVRGEHFIVATGSRPRVPPHVAVDHEHILDSDSILQLPYMPASLVVLGGGVIACEYASIFAALGVAVTIIDRATRPLAFLDEELSERFLQALRAVGGSYLGGKDIKRARFDGLDSVVIELAGGDRVTAEKALCALGRSACISGLGLDKAGVVVNDRGIIPVDQHMRSSVPHIYAAGDVVGPPALASTSMEQGRRAARHALGIPARTAFDVVPVGVYTIPEIGSVGLSEEEARARYGDVLVGRARFDEIARGILSGKSKGMLKIVADAQGRRVLGVHALGDGAAELIHTGQLAMMGGLEIDDLVDHVFNFPTMGEAYRVAALDVLGKRDKRERRDEPQAAE
jgi:NAD(P) transhydrogenase